MIPGPAGDLISDLRDQLERVEADLQYSNADDPTLDEVMTGIRNWSNIVYASATSLYPAPDLDPGIATSADHPVRIPDGSVDNPLVADLLAFLTVQDAVESLDGAFARILELFAHLIRADLSIKAQTYLAHVARLFVWQADIEVRIMARATMERAVRDRLEAALITPKRVLKDCIDQCVSEGMLSPSQRLAADSIRDDANRILHGDLENDGHHELAMQSVRALSTLLTELFPLPAA